MKKRIIVLLLLPFLSGGCAVGPRPLADIELAPELKRLQGVWVSDPEGTVGNEDNKRHLPPALLVALGEDLAGHLEHHYAGNTLTTIDPRHDWKSRMRIRAKASTDDWVLLEIREIEDGDDPAADFLENVGFSRGEPGEVRIEFDGDDAYWVVMTMTTGDPFRERFQRKR